MNRLAKNLSQAERVVRAVVGVVFLFIGLSPSLSPAWSTIMLVLAAFVLITAAVSYCPLYTLFNFSTERSKTNNPE